MNARHGFSLMELIIATAVLAGSGAALFALVGQASRFARIAEERTVALQFAESTMDEFLAGGCNSDGNLEGTFEADPRWSYVIEESAITTDNASMTSPEQSRLKRIVVSIMRVGVQDMQSEDAAIVRLVRWAMTPSESELIDEMSADSEVSSLGSDRATVSPMTEALP
ncbi:hypothetical protein Q31b_11870 [Novipirellula aureliae]|uniref:Uncharacterized protein n=1 Tax=Novipirellula aureliae TaxID=2527966 RepID=A0A5C6EFJ1_9BACT|nr:type II secretion system protein [Novipirellula aureliae]TWU46009.1 hypothetical protein Q31b_11870 [Novipirellula aureliae]